MRRSALLVVAAVLLLGAHSVEADIITADVAVLSPGGQYAPLEVGLSINTNWDRYSWYEVPTFAEGGGFLFWQVEKTGFPAVADGITTFRVLDNGPVLMACTTRWGGGGNSSGDWIPQLTTREQLEAQGWVEFATGLKDIEQNAPPPDFEYIVFRRDSLAGETFTFRTEKYRPPLIIRSETVVPEPSTLVMWLGLGSMGLIAAYRRRRRNG